MRPLLIAAAVLALPAAAQAQPVSDAPIADSLPPPEIIGHGAARLDRVIDGLMEIDVGPLARAIDPGRSGPHERETLGDMARRDDPYFDERIHHSVGALADGMIDLSYRMRRLEPVLRRSLEDVARNVEDAMRDVPHRRYDRDYYDRGD